MSRAIRSWEAIYNVRVPSSLPEDCTCVDLARAVKELLATRVSEDESSQMGFQSIKKLLPDSCKCMESSLLDDLVLRLGKEPRSLPAGYLSFVNKEVDRLFPKGWDASYEGYCLTTSPPLTSCCESGRSDGGVLGAMGGISQADFLERVLHGRGGKICPYYAGKLLVVQSAGKPRPLTKFPAEGLYLKPIHKTIYGALSSKKWLLRGPPSREALLKAGFSADLGDLVSGDYKSATDNLPIEVMEVALARMLRNAISIPENVKELAQRACRPLLFSEKETLEVKVGQMMGSLLSFPFLCLQNYLSFRWSLRSAGIKGHVPVLINGDDILFQEPKPGFSETWFRVVSAVGLEVEQTKTSVARDFGSLNSTLLRWEEGRLVPVWSPRFGMFRPAEHPGSLGSAFLSFLRGAPDEYRFPAAREWFNWHIGEIRSARVSLPSLGFRGLLAKRLAGLFHVLHFDDVEFPRAFRTHGVVMSADFVSRIPTDALSDEERRQASMEIAAQKWTHGWVPLNRVSAAIEYCLARSAVKGRRFDYPDVSRYFAADPLEFQFLLRNRGLEVRRSRLEVAKSFLAPLPSSTETLVPTSWLDSWVPQLGMLLPAYCEFPGVLDLGTVVDRCG